MNEAAIGDSRTRVLSECALCVALTVVLSMLNVFTMPQGGSINLEMAPILVFSCRRGVKWGTAAGAMSGVIQIIYGGYVVHPVQAILDYPLAFACLGVSGLFGRRTIAGMTVACASRLVSHVASGVIFFSAYAPDGQNPLVYSLVYNATIMIPSTIISIAVARLLLIKLSGRHG
ncbi:MAG: energy-coupled thiamine transporter ThiT [Synergistaceae bacterium]|jgi:thiamine transporter|nr:energy-coupled thiamine transporter ThiT [Synergistaceae bacterium]